LQCANAVPNSIENEPNGELGERGKVGEMRIRADAQTWFVDQFSRVAEILPSRIPAARPIQKPCPLCITVSGWLYCRAMGFGVREIVTTPNPNAVKFMLDGRIADRPTSFFNAGAAKGHAMAEKLFGIPGVSSLLFLEDFVTVNKTPDADWREIAERVKAVLSMCGP
jgi:hypothetical protein